MSYSECPQVEALTNRLIAAYREMTDSEIETGTVADDLHLAIMEHKSSCMLCKRIMLSQPASIAGSQRVA